MRFGISSKLLVSAALVWAVIFGVYSVYVYLERIEQTRRMAISTANFLSRKIASDRQYYTSTVVKRALEAGLNVSSSYHDVENAIPLPATFIREVSEAMRSEGGFRMEIVSLAPINPASGPKDAFQKEALDVFSKGSDTRFYRFEDYRGIKSLRYMAPDIATSQLCVDCHNAQPLSPKKDYKIGDVLGGFEVTIPIQSEMAAAMGDIWRSIGYGFVVLLSMGIVGLVIIKKILTSPLDNLVNTTSRLASGDLTGEAAVKSGDELGELGSQTNEVLKNLHRVIEDIRRTSDAAVDLSTRVREMSRHVLEGSHRQGSSLDAIGANLESVNSANSEIANNIESLAVAVEKGSSSLLELGAGINEIVENMESLFTNVDETASSTRDMSFSIKEISENIENLSSAVTQVSSSMVQINARIKEVETNASEASRFAEDVIKDARAGMETVNLTISGIMHTKDITSETKEIINSLSDKMKEISKILDFIRDVADETNLLALNAAIVAAQSGEHGKSFSVVANEIKDLAERTSTSTKEVSEIIGAVEVETERAVKSMERGVEAVQDGVRLSIEAGDGLKKIMESARRSTTGVHEIARASAEQSQQSRTVVEAVERVADMTRRISNAAQEQARGSELINKASERIAEIAYKVKGSARSQAEANRHIAAAIEDVNRMVSFMNSMIREQNRNTAKVLEAIDAVREISVENIEKAVEADRAVEQMASLDRELLESVKWFKLKKRGE